MAFEMKMIPSYGLSVMSNVRPDCGHLRLEEPRHANVADVIVFDLDQGAGQ